MNGYKYSKAAAEANKIIKELHIATPPVDPLEVADYLGVKVSEIEMPEKFEKVSGFMDFTTKEIVLNKDDSSKRKAFTIAHELGHLVLHGTKYIQNPSSYNVLFRLSELNENSDEEKEANTFAACLLAPKEMLKTYSDVPEGIKAKIFGVSPTLLKYRNKF